MSTPAIQVEQHDSVMTVRIDRPKVKGAISPHDAKLLTEILERIAMDTTIRVVVLTGTQGSFCAGLDLGKITDMGMPWEEGLTLMQGAARALYALPQPTIAAINGPAAGFGADLALACDLRLASTLASFGERFVRIGLVPDGGATLLLAELVGKGRALELILSGASLNADQAKEWGIFNQVFSHDNFDAEIGIYAINLAKSAPLAVQASKRLVRPSQAAFEAALAREAEVQAKLLKSSDFQEGVKAFKEKRDATFTGH